MKCKKTGIVTVTVVAVAIALSCLLLLLCSSMSAPALAQEGLPDLAITEIKLYHYYDEEDGTFKCKPWFDLENYVAVTVENMGNEGAEAFNVSLCINNELFSKKEDLSLNAGATTEVPFKWTPSGDDCFDDCSFDDSSEDYEFYAVVDCKNESDNTNNEKAVVEKVCYNGYMADEPLENFAHGTLHGGVIFTTGDGEYGGLYSVGDSMDTGYEITLPAGASVELARLNVYYTWCKPEHLHLCPEMEVSIDGTILQLDASYNDIKCWEPWNIAWGNYVYDITDYIQGSGTYTVTVKNVCTECTYFCTAAPGIVIVYEDKNAPMIEYWINEGADVLLGGRREEGGCLGLDECLNEAKFDGEHMDLEVEKATLGVVAPWGDDAEDDVLYFNGEELGEGVYCGYDASCEKEEESILMSIGGSPAQVGIASFDVTDYLEGCDNEVIQGDDGDNMMPTNAFLVITYEGDEEAEEQIPPDIIQQEPVDTEINNTEGESRTFSVSIDQSVDIVWQLNGTEVQTDEDVTEASYTNASAVLGTWNVSAIGTSRETGLSGIHTWIWNVTDAVSTTPTPAVNITLTPSPTPTPATTPASSLSATPTPTPTPTTATPRPKEKKKAEAEETEIPGFELAMSSFMLIAVAYIQIRYKNKDKGKKKGAVLK
jgi:cell division septation protein DedD